MGSYLLQHQGRAWFFGMFRIASEDPWEDLCFRRLSLTGQMSLACYTYITPKYYSSFHFLFHYQYIYIYMCIIICGISCMTRIFLAWHVPRKSLLLFKLNPLQPEVPEVGRIERPDRTHRLLWVLHRMKLPILGSAQHPYN